MDAPWTLLGISSGFAVCDRGVSDTQHRGGVLLEAQIVTGSCRGAARVGGGVQGAPVRRQRTAGMVRSSILAFAMLHMQAAAYRVLLSDAPHAAIADHAGSGKTLAYLAPLVQALRAEEAAAGRPVTQPNCPRLLVVTPTEGTPTLQRSVQQPFFHRQMPSGVTCTMASTSEGPEHQLLCRHL